MSLPRALRVATAHDHAVGALVLASLVTLGEHAPRAHRMLTCRSAAFAAAVRVVDRIHRHTANGRTHAAPAHAARLADRFQRVLFVAHFADRRAAVDVHAADLAGAEAQLRIF